jgi:hypothetical protein
MFPRLHSFLKALWSGWLALYLGFILFKLAKNIIPCTFMGFDGSNVYLLDIIFTMYKAVLWLSPTLFLYAALQLSRPHKARGQ